MIPESAQCQCGEGAVKFCPGCDLAYCQSCSERRHRKGAFQRHNPVTLDPYSSKELKPQDMSCSSPEIRNVCCEDCLENRAALWCKACELNYCEGCCKEVHRAGNLQCHGKEGCFQRFAAASRQGSIKANELVLEQSPNQKCLSNEKEYMYASKSRSELRQEESTSNTQPHKSSDFVDDGQSTQSVCEPGEPEVETDAKEDDDGKTEKLQEGRTDHDPWSNWSPRSFTNQSSSTSRSPQWRSLRSLSIDHVQDTSSTASSPELSLKQISKSLQALSLIPSSSDARNALKVPEGELFSSRPRSFSEFSGLSARHLSSTWERKTNPVAETSNSVYKGVQELARAFQTEFPSRHIILHNASGLLDKQYIDSIARNLQEYGGVVSIRSEFACEGILFATFFELKSAIAAVKGWNGSDRLAHQNAVDSSKGGSTRKPSCSIHFSLPFESINDSNCAHILVELQGSPISCDDMRQFCSRFGEVASVLQQDMHSSQYIVEYNDARDVKRAIEALTCSFHTSGPIAASRTTPPMLDTCKIQLFQECVESLSIVSPVLEPMVRPKSYSASGASLLTSPTSSSSSALSASFLESSSMDLNSNPVGQLASLPARASSPFAVGAYPIDGSALMRTMGSSVTTTTHSDVWHSERSAPVKANAPPSGSPSQSTSSTLTTYRDSSFQQAISSSTGNDNAQLQYPASSAGATHQAHQRISLANRLGPVRCGSDPCFRTNATLNLSSSSMTGRNDQGTGEFSLSIDRVQSGEDQRTTLMIRNIPNKYTQQMLLAEINHNHRGQYDFFYLPIDFKNKCNMGYAFINFMEYERIIPFYKEFNNQKWTNFNSEKVCAISYARLQGKQAMINRFQNSSLLEKHESYRPLVFVSQGPNRGTPEPFPSPKHPPKKAPIMAHQALHHLPQPHGSALHHHYGNVPSDFPARMYSQQQLLFQHSHVPAQHGQHLLPHHQHPLMAQLHLQQTMMHHHNLGSHHQLLMHHAGASSSQLYRDRVHHGGSRYGVSGETQRSFAEANFRDQRASYPSYGSVANNSANGPSTNISHTSSFPVPSLNAGQSNSSTGFR